MGGAVRATDSGLACPDWPACYGKWIPPADVNMWFEHSHRLWAGVVGIAIAALAVWTLVRFRERRVLWSLSVTALVLVVAQAALGAGVVLLGLPAGLVTAHLAMSLLVVACLITLAVMTRRPAPAGRSDGVRWVGRWAASTGGLVFVQALLGGQATGRGAAFVFNAVPIWLADQVWSGHAREWLHVIHRTGGYVVATAVIVFAVAVHRRRRDDPTLPTWTTTLAWVAVGLVVVQIGLGMANVVTRAAAPVAVAHLAVASWLWSTFVLLSALAWLTPVSSQADDGDAAARPGSGYVRGTAMAPDAADGPHHATQEVNA